MKICNWQHTTKDRLNDIAEARKINEALVKHYNFILDNYDSIITIHDKDIAVIEIEKAEVLRQFIEAPEKLKELASSLVELQKTKDVVSNKRQKINQLKSLKERIAILRQECVDDGIDIEKILEED